MQIELGYPAPSEERQLLANGERRTLVDQLQPVLSLDALLRLQDQVAQVHVSEALLDYVQALIAYTRESGEFVAGFSPRGGIALVRAAQAWALMAGHGGVHPEDIQAVLGSIARIGCSAARQLARARTRDRRSGILATFPYLELRTAVASAGRPIGRSGAKALIRSGSRCDAAGSTSCRRVSAQSSARSCLRCCSAR